MVFVDGNNNTVNLPNITVNLKPKACYNVCVAEGGVAASSHVLENFKPQRMMIFSVPTTVLGKDLWPGMGIPICDATEVNVDHVYVIMEGADGCLLTEMTTSGPSTHLFPKMPGVPQAEAHHSVSVAVDLSAKVVIEQASQGFEVFHPFENNCVDYAKRVASQLHCEFSINNPIELTGIVKRNTNLARKLISDRFPPVVAFVEANPEFVRDALLQCPSLVIPFKSAFGDASEHVLTENKRAAEDSCQHVPAAKRVKA